MSVFPHHPPELTDMTTSTPSRKIAYGLYGTGGCARGAMPLLAAHIATLAKRDPHTLHEVFFVDVKLSGPTINGYPALSEKDFLALDHGRKYYNVAIANSRIRERVVRDMEAAGIAPISVIAPDVLTYDAVHIGEGALLNARTIITSNIQIGRHFHCNLASYVSHDCVIGDFVTFAPNVHCNGNIHIHDHVYVGCGAMLKQGTPDQPLVIGEGAIIGMGAVVIQDVPPYTTVVGVPARPLKHREKTLPTHIPAHALSRRDRSPLDSVQTEIRGGEHFETAYEHIYRSGTGQ